MKRLSKTEAVRFFERKLAFTTGPIELNELLKGRHDVTVVDVRRPEDYRKGHIPTAINLPREEWGTLRGLERGKPVAVYCYSQQCHLAARACLEFALKGFRVMELEGGWHAWKEYGLEIEGEKKLRRAA